MTKESFQGTFRSRRPKRLWSGCPFFIVLLTSFSVFGCSIVQTRPVQEMSDTASAIRAAREVQADSTAPELFRQANETFFRARNEYRLKNFEEARILAEKARLYAEEAEFDALKSGASRSRDSGLDPFNSPDLDTYSEEPSYEKYQYPKPQGSFARDIKDPGPAPQPSAQPSPFPSGTP